MNKCDEQQRCMYDTQCEIYMMNCSQHKPVVPQEAIDKVKEWANAIEADSYDKALMKRVADEMRVWSNANSE